jgi:hypothetical protein
MSMSWSAILAGLAALSANAANYELKATPQTVVVGYYWSEAKPS